MDEIDVARYTIRAMGDPRTLNKTVHITPHANILSQNDLVSIWEEKSGAVLKKAFVAPAEIEGHMKGKLIRVSLDEGPRPVYATRQVLSHMDWRQDCIVLV